ncbi:EF-hand domain-containing protein [Sediminicurvatus halobius]|uniref:EF-hand domain-containing protein n=1 Tax=Sediminicurvatus halobius TaxID=2182432 RepID=A0A2U2MXH3_9GAMM|nr:EF-hand domain-containing protein [Spiribacter halobius]PWG61577.1 hypothetical protein DEM34_15855 [Spiribacter halobius]UEX77146.1 EF-hand domain-containing protein [Spiribacter halobius]
MIRKTLLTLALAATVTPALAAVKSGIELAEERAPVAKSEVQDRFLKRHFNRYDNDRDGQLDAQELSVYIQTNLGARSAGQR